MFRNPHTLCALAMLFYSIEIVTTDLRLRNIHPRLITACYSGGVFLCAIIFLLVQARAKHETIIFPTRIQWGYIVLMVGASFIAATTHFMALNREVGAVQLALYYALLPVMCAAIEAIFGGELPSVRVVMGWVFAVIALWCVAGTPKPS